MFASTCRIDISWFPFDDQQCQMKFGSWTYDVTGVDLQLQNTSGDTSTFIPSGEWELIGRKITLTRTTTIILIITTTFIIILMTITLITITTTTLITIVTIIITLIITTITTTTTTTTTTTIIIIIIIIITTKTLIAIRSRAIGRAAVFANSRLIFGISVLFFFVTLSSLLHSVQDCEVICVLKGKNWSREATISTLTSPLVWTSQLQKAGA